MVLEASVGPGGERRPEVAVRSIQAFLEALVARGGAELQGQIQTEVACFGLLAGVAVPCWRAGLLCRCVCASCAMFSGLAVVVLGPAPW